ncbi:alcohol dehydrogenase catalytic domain-containing protein [Streptomyces sp. NPDC051677]|uniref:alcohol dehydrogenase catalytic domain-containing protein n=1 Tax=Streptomyces sp. NPDC051677 TaxID=3365669 RepID=UPI0037CE3C72
MVKALVARGATAELSVEDVELPEPAAGEVRVRVRAAGVCHSDLSMINGTVSPEFPLVLGHEAAGVVIAAGAGVTRVAVGDHVAINWSPACRECWFCRRGEPWLCVTAEGVSSRPRGRLADGTPAHVTLGVGALAEEVVVGERALITLPRQLPLAEAALMGCAVLTGVGAVRNTAGVGPGESVVVLGLGGVGLSAVAGARLAGADPIIAVDVSPEKEGLARACGATEFLLSDKGLPKAIRSLTGGRGADHVFECVGRAATIRTAWQSARRGGNCVVVGMGARDDMVSFSALEVFHFARSLTSSVYGSADADHDVPLIAAAALDGSLDLGALVTHRISLADVPEAFERMRRGEGARSLVLFD